MLDLSEAFRIYLTLFRDGVYSETFDGEGCRRLSVVWDRAGLVVCGWWGFDKGVGVRTG